MANILIVEDDEQVSSILERWIGSAVRPGGRIALARTFRAASELISSTHFDLIFCDLLLLPLGSRLESGLLTLPSEEARRFGPADWTQFVVEQGGVALIRRARFSA